MKKQNRSLNLVLSLLPFILALVVFVLMFFDAAVLRNNNGDIIGQYSGLQVSFGFKEAGGLGTNHSIGFNFLLVLAYLLPLLSSILVVVFGIVKKDRLASIFAIVLAVSFVLSAIALFTLLPATTVHGGILGINTFATLTDLGYELSFATIVAAIASLVAALLSLGQIALGFLRK